MVDNAGEIIQYGLHQSLTLPQSQISFFFISNIDKRQNAFFGTRNYIYRRRDCTFVSANSYQLEFVF
ncbi:hypothetical protein DSCW_36110 [Desulfosarcina widdelii]|uniref:Uncharacterized protein n=1 Tax=Desulfosarcina widdelii TaxID=947919 RepID=A0A5K7ZCK7_9BACT|nr:hypothetical protein DSCW_36110 [Desulfosarcina widdelii]